MAKSLGKANPFENLEDAFDVPSVMDNDPQEIPKQELEVKKINTSELVPVSNSSKQLNDEAYIRTRMMELIESTTRVMSKLEDEIKIGTGDRTFEVYSELADSVNKQLMALTDMNATVEKVKLEKRKIKLKQKKEMNVSDVKGKVMLTATQVADMIKRAGEESNLKKIDAKFTITDERDEE